MRSLLGIDRPPPPAEPTRRRRVSRPARWILCGAAGALLAAALGSLVADQVRADGRLDRAKSSLGVTEQRTHTVSGQLAELRSDLSALKTQVGNDATALSQDSSQLLGAQTSLSAAQAHVTQQASLISSLQTCLVGVEQALNALSVGSQPRAIAALNSVSSSCTAAETSSG